MILYMEDEIDVVCCYFCRRDLSAGEVYARIREPDFPGEDNVCKDCYVKYHNFPTVDFDMVVVK